MQLTVTIPKDWELSVREKDTVDFSTPIIHSTVMKPAAIPLAQIINIAPKKIFTVLKKFVGEEVKKGDLIAFNKGFLFSKKYISEYDGILKEVNHNDGHIVIDYRTEEKNTRDSFFKGLIESVADDGPMFTKIQIKAEKVADYEIVEPSDYFGGPVSYFEMQLLPTATEDMVAGKVICVEALKSYDLSKLEALGAKAFLTVESLPEQSHTPSGKITNIESWKKIMEAKLPYCTVDREKSTIFFYQSSS